MEVICLEDEALISLVELVVERLRSETKETQSKWMGTEDTMQFLGIKSKTTLQNLRDTGAIRFTQPQKRIILYDRNSLEAYLEKNTKETF